MLADRNTMQAEGGLQRFADGLAQIDCVVSTPRRLSILGVQTSCGCIWTEDLPLVVQAGERKTIRFQFDRTRRVGVKANIPIDLTVRFLINGEPIPLVGTVSVIPTMDFGE